MSTGSPSEAREAEAWVVKHGGKFLAATIMGYPVSIGKTEAQFLVSGPEDIFQDYEHYLKFLGGDIRYLGTNIGAAAALNLAIIGRFVGNTISIIHGANVCESEGVTLDQYSNMYPEGDRARSLIKSIRTNNFEMDGGVSVNVAADCAASLQSQAKDIGINSEFPNFIMSLLQRAIDAGYRDEDTAAQIKILRRDTIC